MTDAAWYYLSFANESGFLGGCYVRAVQDDPELEAALMLDAAKKRGDGTTVNEAELQTMLAIVATHRLGINPGASALATGPFTDEHMDKYVPVADRERLLSREEIENA